MIDVIFWLAMLGAFMLGWPEWVIWWKVYQWKRNMRKGFDNEWSAQQRSASDEGPAG